MLPDNARHRMVIVRNQRMTFFGGYEISDVYHCSLDKILKACEISRKEYQNGTGEEKDGEVKKENEVTTYLTDHALVAFEGCLYLNSEKSTLWKWRCPFLLCSLVHFVKLFIVANNITV